MTWDSAKFIGCDYETSGVKPEFALQPWRIRRKQTWATSLVWMYTSDGEQHVMGGLFPKRSDIRTMLEFARDTGRTIVCWNALFDISVCIGYGFYDLVMQCTWLDAMLLWRHLHVEPEYDETGRNKKSYALKPGGMAEFLPQFAGYEEDVDYHSTEPGELAKLHAYNVKDVDYTLQIAALIVARLTAKQLTCATIEAACLPMVAAANMQGMLVDVPELHEHGAALLLKSERLLAKLSPYGVTAKVAASPTKLGVLLFDTWKLPVLKLTKAKARSTDKETLHELGLFDPRAKDVRDYREALNLKSKFVDTILEAEAYNEDGYVRPAAIVSGTYTGRMTYSSKQGRNKTEVQTGFAIHQTKNAKRFRDAIIAPPGYTIVEFDAAGQEFRWMAVFSKDATMLGLCEDGEDAHSFMGSKISHLDYRWIQANKEIDKEAKRYRKSGKVGNLCCAQGTAILTDRGVCSIEDVRGDDLVWDGVEFVSHEGVSFSGVREVITHDGVTATPDHRVFIQGKEIRLDEAQRMGWTIDRACQAGSAVRIVGGLARRTAREVWGDLRTGALRLWGGARDQLAYDGGREDYAVQGVRNTPTASARRGFDSRDTRRQTTSEARQCDVSTMSEPQRSVVAQLRRAWDRVSVRFSARGCGIHQRASTPPDVSEVGYRPTRQRWSLRSWKLALGFAQSEPQQSVAKVPTYDIVNCGPRTRFSANGRIVHNSLQYRTSAKKFVSVARVQYDIPMLLPEGQLIWTTYQRTYKGVPRFWENQIRNTAAKGYVETLAGRRIQVKGDWSGPNRWRMQSTSINTPIQGTGADQKYLALLCVKNTLNATGSYFFLDMHDGLYFLVPDANVRQFCDETKDVLDNLPYAEAWGFKPSVPLPFDCKVGKAWGSLQEYKFA